MAFHVNWGLGFFRAWVIFSIVITALLVAESYSRIADEFRRERAANEDWGNIAVLMLPADCRQARGKDGEDYKREEDGPWLQYRSNPEMRLCWYEEPKFRSLYPEYKDMETKELSRKLYAAAGRAVRDARPWREVGELAALIAGICGGVFLIGASVGWVLSGFTRTGKAS
jgi:hypothetical protein